ncbi:hypothetical protein NM688_g2398 [Phlebia brevispora]|uniref:Uncharacterized protein n=1 Tax=Phlebia brevispora TaxID=194682 RepID=A0ACC1T933_9APHY|nr:hypothetical protein NM688_g2398 [Phlebia brevispora]
MFEFQTITIFKALTKWKDKLLGQYIWIVTNHKALEFFKMQPRLSQRQTRWMEYMSHFDYDIEYIKGKINKVTDCLSWYYLNDTDSEKHLYDDYVSIDVCLDPKSEDLPQDHLIEVHVMEAAELEVHAIHESKNQSTSKGKLMAMISEEDLMPLRKQVKNDTSFLTSIYEGYADDPLFSKILKSVDDHKAFLLKDGLI